MSNRKVFFIFTILLCIASLSAQSLSLADFELETAGYIDPATDKPLFPTYGTLSARLVPASWIRFQAQLDLDIPDSAMFFHPVPESNSPGILTFKGGFVEFPSVAGQPLNISVFTGYFDDPASGSLLRKMMKVEIPASEFHGKPGGLAFSPETGITGSGLAVTAVPYNKSTALGFYGYWNDRTDDTSKITYDTRVAMATGALQFNAFGGATYEKGPAEISFRGGVTTLLNTGSGNELYTEIGIKSFSVGQSGLDRNLYFLFEPRLYWERADMAISFFSSPVFPSNVPGYVTVDAESNYIGANLLTAFGNIRLDRMRGGISLLGSINPADPGTVTPFSFSISPFYSIMISDFLLDITAVIKPLLYDDPESVGELRLNLKAVY